MAGSGSKTGKKGGADALLLALASGLSVPKAAAKSGLSERTAYRRLQDPAFRRSVAAARAAMVERALGHLSAGSAEATAVLRKLLRSPDGKLQLGAARCILENQQRLRAEVDLAVQLQEIRDHLAQQQQQQPPFTP